MKLNFLKVLSNQNNTPEEIAEQMVALEQKQVEYQKQRDALRQQAKELRQKKLCGETVSETQIADADRRVENANLDLEAVAESIANLNDKLRKTYEAIIENGQAVAGQKIKAIELEHDRLTEELARAKAKVLVIAEQLWGTSIVRKLKDSSVFDDDPNTDQFMKDEADKLRSSVKEPTYYSKFRQAESYSSWTSGININDEMSSILEKHRAKMDVPVKELV